MNFLNRTKNLKRNKRILLSFAFVGIFVLTSIFVSVLSGFETNVSATASPFLSDLETSHASVAGGELVSAGSEVIFDFKVKNIGEADAPEHSITCYIDGEEFDSGFNGNALAPGEEDWSWCQIDDIGAPGEYEFSICVDEEGAVEETDESNNCDNTTFTVVDTTGTTPPTGGACLSANGSSLSVLEFEEAMDNGLISFNLNTNEGNGTATFTMENETNCTAPISLSSYKMFDPPPTLNTQEFFDGTGLVNAGESSVLSIDLPNCKAQVDAWYGLHPETLLASNPYEFPKDVPSVLAFNVTSGSLCDSGTPPPPPPPPPSAPSCTLNVNPSTITSGGSSTLSWTTTNAASASLNQGIGGVGLNGSTSVSPTSSKTYTLTVVGQNSSTITCSKTVNVTDTPPPPPPAPSCSLSANPSTITSGGSSTLSWTTTNAASASLNQGIGGVALSGSRSVSPSNTTSYTLTVNGTNGSTITCATSVVVNPPPGPSCTLSANPTVITSGGSSTLTWTTSNAVSASINQGIGSVLLNGSKSVGPGNTTTYTLIATSSTGATASCGATVSVSSVPLADVSIVKSVNNTQLQKGSIFTYTLNYANSGNLSAQNVTINDTPSPTGLLTNFTITSGPNHGSCSAKTNGIECDLGTLPVGASGSVVYRATGENVGNVTNTAVINTTTSETSTANNQDSESISIFLPPTGGCVTNCSGGLDQPNVVLFQSPSDDSLASQSFIYLSQIPYTGLVGNFKTMFILTLLLLLSIYLSYILIEKKALNRVFSAVFNGREKTGGVELVEEKFNINQNYELYASALATASGVLSDRESREKPYLSGVVSPEREVVKADDSNKNNSLEQSRKDLTKIAKAEEALMSDDALELIEVVSEIKKVEKELVLKDLIKHAKKNYPKEDGYLIIDSDRAEKILFSIETNIVQTFTSWLSEGKDKDALNFIRTLRNNNISIENFIKRVVYYIDNFYRCQIGEAIDESHQEVDFHTNEYCWNKDDLQEVVAVLVSAVDESYKSQDASIKLALIKVNEISKRAQSRKSYYSV